MNQSEKREFLPFHESIIEAIDTFPTSCAPQLLEWIARTKIPANYDDIRLAIERRWGDNDRLGHHVVQAKASLREQQTISLIKERILAILANLIEIPKDQIKDTNKLGKDLKIGQGPIGQGKFLELRNLVEREFDILVPIESLPLTSEAAEVTVGELVGFVAQTIAINSAPERKRRELVK